MQRDVLFLLPPGFAANGRREYCPECAEIWGLLHYYPALKETLDVCYVSITHPRAPICELLGEGNWNAPTLVIKTEAVDGTHQEVPVSNGLAYLDSAKAIGRYFSEMYGTAVPRGS